ncbi:hypothetical protein NL676_009521 [Syzygium grande]|nr:hypothetical protein NL676_009521 [Syzygium grande]
MATLTRGILLKLLRSMNSSSARVARRPPLRPPPGCRHRPALAAPMTSAQPRLLPPPLRLPPLHPRLPLRPRHQPHPLEPPPTRPLRPPRPPPPRPRLTRPAPPASAPPGRHPFLGSPEPLSYEMGNLVKRSANSVKCRMATDVREASPAAARASEGEPRRGRARLAGVGRGSPASGQGRPAWIRAGQGSGVGQGSGAGRGSPASGEAHPRLGGRGSLALANEVAGDLAGKGNPAGKKKKIQKFFYSY